MNIFDIDASIERQLDHILRLKETVDGIEDGTIVVCPEEFESYLGNLYASYTDPTTIPENVSRCYFAIDDATLTDVHEVLNLCIKVEEDKLCNIAEDLDEKINAYSYVVKQAIIDATTAKDEAARFAARAKTSVNKAERLKTILIMILDKYGEVGKSGNKTHRTDKFNLYTTEKKSVEIDESLFSDDDKDNFTDVSFRMPTSDYNAFIALIGENPEVLEDVNLDQVDINGIKSSRYFNKTNLGNRLKQSEVIKGVSHKPSTSLTIK